MIGRALGWLAFGLMASGIILGFMRLDVGSAKCGSLFTGEPDHSSSVIEGFGDSSDAADAAAGAVADVTCSQQRTGQWRTAVPLMVVGVFLGLGAAHVSDGESKRVREQRLAQPDPS